MRIYSLILLVLLSSGPAIAGQTESEKDNQLYELIKEVKALLNKAGIDFGAISVLLNSGGQYFMPMDEFSRSGQLDAAIKLEQKGLVIIAKFEQIRGVPGPFISVKPTELGKKIISLIESP